MSYDFSSLRILIVDDSAHMRLLVKRVLTSFNITYVAEVSDGNQAIQVMGEKMPDIVITDFAMERMDGIELTRFIRLSDESPNPYLPIIMMTGFTEMHRVVEARDAGVSEIVAKPVSATAMFSRLVAVVERPRPFIRIDGFFGPDRRRRQVPLKGPDRRLAGKDPAGALEIEID